MRKSSAEAHAADVATDVEDQNSEAFSLTSESDDESLVNSVFASSDSTKSTSADQERGIMQV